MFANMYAFNIMQQQYCMYAFNIMQQQYLMHSAIKLPGE